MMQKISNKKVKKIYKKLLTFVSKFFSTLLFYSNFLYFILNFYYTNITISTIFSFSYWTVTYIVPYFFKIIDIIINFDV